MSLRNHALFTAFVLAGIVLSGCTTAPVAPAPAASHPH